MKRKFTLAIVAISAIGGTWSCFSMGQDPFGAAQAPVANVGTVYRSNGAVAGITGVGPDVAATVSSEFIVEESALAKTVATLAKQLKSAEGAEKESITQKLTVAVAAQFDIRHNGKAKELKALEEQLAKLKEIHTKRTEQRERIVTDRIKQILLEVDSLGWGLSDASEPSNLYTTSSGWDLSAPRGFATKIGVSGPATVPAVVPTTSTSPAVRVPGQPTGR